MITALVDLLVQLLFIFRTWMRECCIIRLTGPLMSFNYASIVSNRSRLLVVCFLVLVIGEFAVAILSFAKSLGVKQFSENDKTTLPTARAAAAVGAFVDTALALTLIVLHRRRKSEFLRMNSLVDRMAHSIGTGLLSEAWAYVIGTGLITGAFALAGLVSSLIWPRNFVFILFLEMLPKCELSSYYDACTGTNLEIDL